MAHEHEYEEEIMEEEEHIHVERPTIVAPSILSADFANLGAEVRRVGGGVHPHRCDGWDVCAEYHDGCMCG